MFRPGDKLGPYTLDHLIGTGAFGVVWLATHSVSGAQHALKFPTNANAKDVINEASVWDRATGHPNILPIINADVYNGHIVIISEYAPDGSLKERMATQRLTVDAAVKMFLGMLAGLEHLHSRQIIHRDLKPSNILFRGDTPLIADFGIAKVLMPDAWLTQIKGTPSYMAPEAFDGSPSAQTDLWAASVIFYLMLTGCQPFSYSDDFGKQERIIKTESPLTLPDEIPRPLRPIVEQSLQKRPDDRYKSATLMLDALRRMKLDESRWKFDLTDTRDKSTIISKKQPPQPITLLDNSGKQQRAGYNKADVQKASGANPGPDKGRPEPDDDQEKTHLRPRQAPLSKSPRRSTFFDKYKRLIFTAALFILMFAVWYVFIAGPSNNSEGDTLDGSLSKPFKKDVLDHHAAVQALTFSPDGNILVSIDALGNEAGWHIASGERQQWGGSNKAGAPATYEPQGKVLADVDNSNRINNIVKLWTGGERKRNLGENDKIGQVLAITFSQNGNILRGVNTHGEVFKWDAHTGILESPKQENKNASKPIPKVTKPAGSPARKPPVSAAAFSPDGKILAMGMEDGTINVLDLETKSVATMKGGHKIKVLSLTFSSDGKTLASGSEDETIKVWDVQTGSLKWAFQEHDKIMALAFSPDDTILASGGSNHIVKLWDAQSGEPKPDFVGHKGRVLSVRFSPDGKILASGSADRTVRLWDMKGKY